MQKEKKIKYIFAGVILFWAMLSGYAWFACKNTSKDLAGFGYEIPFLAGCIFVLLGSVFVTWLICIKKAGLPEIYLGISFVVLSLLLWTQTPLHHHDNEFHYDSAYVLSDMLLGEKTDVGLAGGRLKTYVRRECDEFMHYSAYNNFIHAYADMQKEMFSEPKTTETDLAEKATYQGAVSEPLYFYLPQAVGFCVARLADLNVYWLLYLGRLFLAVVCTLITWRAIKNAPAFQEIFLLSGLIPTTLWSYVTVSRDALILAFSFYFISKCLQLAYTQNKAKWQDYMLLAGSLLLLAPYKMVYIPFIFLTGLLLCRRKKKGTLDKKILLPAVAVAAVIVVFFVYINFDYFKIYLTGTNRGALTDGEPFTIPYVFSHLGQTIMVVLRTLASSSVRFAANMIAIGDYGGGIHKEMVLAEGVFMLLMLLWNNQSKKEEAVTIAGKERMVMAVTWLAICAMIYAVYLLVTPNTNEVIIGIQGRYFTPVLPLILLTFCQLPQRKKIKNKNVEKIQAFLDGENVRQGVLLGIYATALFVAVNMFVWVMTYVHPI